MITAQEASDLAVLANQKLNDNFFKQSLEQIRHAAERGHTSTYLRNFDDALLPSVENLISLGFKVEIAGYTFIRVYWGPKKSWFSRLLGG